MTIELLTKILGVILLIGFIVSKFRFIDKYRCGDILDTIYYGCMAIMDLLLFLMLRGGW